MSRSNQMILLAAVLLIVLGVYFEVTLLQGVTGLLLLAGLIYSYIVAKREVALLKHARNREFEANDPSNPTPWLKPAE